MFFVRIPGKYFWINVTNFKGQHQMQIKNEFEKNLLTALIIILCINRHCLEQLCWLHWKTKKFNERTMDLKSREHKHLKAKSSLKQQLPDTNNREHVQCNTWTTKSIRKKQIQTSFPCGNHLSHQETNFNPVA